MRTSDFDYNLPPGAIAQEPVRPRDSSKLLRLDRATGKRTHLVFTDITRLLRRGDLLVLNDTKVVPARITLRRRTGSRIEALLVKKVSAGVYISMTSRGSRIKSGEELDIEGSDLAARPGAPWRARAVERTPEGRWVLAFPKGFEDWLGEFGRAPLPPYIKRDKEDSRGANDISDYQTVYGKIPGSIAAPTAGLHFTNDLLLAIMGMVVEVERVTLSVGPGTFIPVVSDIVEDHEMERESAKVSAEAAGRVNAAKEEGRRVVAVGTTTVRTLEWAIRKSGGERLRPIEGNADIFIYPGFEFKAVDALLTNFHLPRSTLLMLVSAFASRDEILAAYSEAIERGYRFYSYGDAMFIT